MRILARATALIVAAFLGPLLAAQSHFSARSDLVVLNVAVTDARGGFVGGLPASAFQVLEGGRPQMVSFFGEQDAPASIGLLIDSSGSMLQSADRLIAGVASFAEASHPDDEFLPLVFNERVTPLLNSDRGFTDDPVELREALTKTFHARGRTAFHDALAVAIDAISRGRHDRKVLIVLSDGGDNASRLTFDDVLGKALASNVVIYSIALLDPLTLEHNPQALRRLAESTGGLAFQPRTVSLVGPVFRSIAADVRSRYVLAYAPADTEADGRLRRVRVTVQAPGYRGLTIRTRTGYVVDAAGAGADHSAADRCGVTR